MLVGYVRIVSRQGLITWVNPNLIHLVKKKTLVLIGYLAFKKISTNKLLYLIS